MSWNIANPAAAAAAANSHTTTNSTIQQQQTQAQANLNNSLQNHPNQVVKTTAVTIPQQTQQPKIQINTPPPHNILGRANIPIPNPPTRSPISQQQQQQQQQHYTTSLMNNHAAQQHIEKGLKNF